MTGLLLTGRVERGISTSRSQPSGPLNRVGGKESGKKAGVCRVFIVLLAVDFASNCHFFKELFMNKTPAYPGRGRILSISCVFLSAPSQRRRIV